MDSIGLMLRAHLARRARWASILRDALASLGLLRMRAEQGLYGTTAETSVMPQAVELKNPVIERMRAGDVSLGMIVRLARSGDIARIAKTTGHDFIFIDRQHALFSLETVGHIAQAALG